MLLLINQTFGQLNGFTVLWLGVPVKTKRAHGQCPSTTEQELLLEADGAGHGIEDLMDAHTVQVDRVAADGNVGDGLPGQAESVGLWGVSEGAEMGNWVIGNWKSIESTTITNFIW